MQLPADAQIANSNTELRSIVEPYLRTRLEQTGHRQTAQQQTTQEQAPQQQVPQESARPEPSPQEPVSPLMADILPDEILTVGIAGGDIWKATGAASNTAARLGRGHASSGYANRNGASSNHANRNSANRDQAVQAHGALIDAVSVQADSHQYWCCAHVLVRRRWWRDRIVAVMNSEWLGPWRVAPNAHPGDGYLNVVEATSSYRFSQRLLARRRLRTGDHLPHPHLKARRITESSFEFDKPFGLWLDGTSVGTVRSLTVKVVPSAIRVVF